MPVTNSTKTVVGVFDSMKEAEAAIRELQNNGFSREEMSLVANRIENTHPDIEAASPGHPGIMDRTADIAADAGLGAALGGIGGLLFGLAGLTVPGIGPILAAGPIVGMIGGMGLGAAAGGIIGVLTESGVPKEEAAAYAESVRRGHVLVTVESENDDRANRAREIMDNSAAVDIERRVSSWRRRGWTGYNPGAEPLSADELRREREYYGAAEQQADEWESLTEQEKQDADPALRDTRWPHREAHPMEESLEKIEREELLESPPRGLDLSSDERAFQNSNPQFGASIENNVRRTDPAVARAESGFERAMESAVRSARRRARVFKKTG